jgi:hypothetical protein
MVVSTALFFGVLMMARCCEVTPEKVEIKRKEVEQTLFKQWAQKTQ